MKRIFCDIEKCIACKACVLACAVEHSKSKDLMEAIREEPEPKHRIRIVEVDDGESPSRIQNIALQCRHCEDAPCIEACKPGCITRDEATGNVSIDHETCEACWVCIKACPYGVIVRHRNLGTAVKCDHCPGRDVPACVEACRTGALDYCDGNEAEYSDSVKKIIEK